MSYYGEDEDYGPDQRQIACDIIWQLAERVSEMASEIAKLKDELHHATRAQHREEDMKTIL